MDKQKSATIACPACGNINPYLQDECMKCGTPLTPIREALENIKVVPKNKSPESPKSIEPPPPLPELPSRPEQNRTGKFFNSNAFLIRGMGERAEEIAARFFNKLAARNIQGLTLSVGNIILNLGEKQDSRQYYFAERDIGDGALAIMAVRINPVGTDLYIEWRNYALPSWQPRSPFSWFWFIVGLIFYIIPGILYYYNYEKNKDKPPEYRKSDLEGFQFQENEAFQLTVRAALEEAIDSAGISKSYIQNISTDDKSERVI